MENTTDTASAHTPGPWSVDPLGSDDTGRIRVWQTSGPAICELLDFPEAAANARLIATAPELLKLAKSFRSACKVRIGVLKQEREHYDPEDHDDVDDQIEHWQAWQDHCEQTINAAVA